MTPKTQFKKKKKTGARDQESEEAGDESGILPSGQTQGLGSRTKESKSRYTGVDVMPGLSAQGEQNLTVFFRF